MCYNRGNKGRWKPKKNHQPKGRKDNIMKVWRLTTESKGGMGYLGCIYTVAETESAARCYFEENFNRFNLLLSVTDITDTAKGQEILKAHQEG